MWCSETNQIFWKDFSTNNKNQVVDSTALWLGLFFYSPQYLVFLLTHKDSSFTFSQRTDRLVKDSSSGERGGGFPLPKDTVPPMWRNVITNVVHDDIILTRFHHSFKFERLYEANKWSRMHNVLILMSHVTKERVSRGKLDLLMNPNKLFLWQEVYITMDRYLLPEGRVSNIVRGRRGLQESFLYASRSCPFFLAWKA